MNKVFMDFFFLQKQGLFSTHFENFSAHCSRVRKKKVVNAGFQTQHTAVKKIKLTVNNEVVF